MTLQDELTAARRCIDDLVRRVDRLEQEVGSGLEIRRVRTDANHLRESIALLIESAPQARTGSPPEMVIIPDDPYKSSLWTDTDDEGIGHRDHHAP
ncbi:hypothetical protein [Streptomyces gobiensis]|uniref:hypothetical protein n=1 Tax=Streptomyces gobiensis TaxID=2875706 RepID=UPI001E5A85AB|nr:hypothetical protein [Streptomyces gobiensis]UGY93451.1 hypothetical protein test1122_18145 [Streptomyces gobiensis]